MKQLQIDMKKHVLIAFAIGLCLTASVMAQVPNYVPTNGLVGYWPFNGNANDESGNGNNGTVNGATLTTDRFGVANKAYSFNGGNQKIQTNYAGILGQNARSISLWYLSNTNEGGLMYYGLTSPGSRMNIYLYPTNSGGHSPTIDNSNSQVAHNPITPIGTWNNLIITYQPSFGTSTSSFKFYINGVLSTSEYFNYNANQNFNTQLGDLVWFGSLVGQDLYGKLDDIGIWNRALTQQEITALYNSCSGTNITSQPSNSSVTIGSTAQFSIGSTVGGSFQWQSNPLDLGWQNVVDNSTYSGGTTNILSVANTSVSNNNQPFRAIVNTGNCSDTSNMATIQIADTCITNVTIYDTLLTTVTDTLIINTTLSLPAPNNENTILIYPNPASDHITIDNGNFAAMAGYSIKIENNAGQQVFQNTINQAQFYVDLSTWTGNGLYFVHLIDAQGNTVTVRKIVLQ